MITITLNKIRNNPIDKPCAIGWEKLLKYKGGTKADMDAEFPLYDVISSNGLDDALWCLRCLPEHGRLWRKLAVDYARRFQHLMTDQRSIDAIDVAWRHSDGLATDEELAAAWDAAWDAEQDVEQDVERDVERDSARAAARAAALYAAWAAAWDAAWSVAWAATRDAERQYQEFKLRQIIQAGEWVE